MPVTKSCTITHYLISANVRMDPGTHLPAGMSVELQRCLDDVPDGELIRVEMAGSDLEAFLATEPTPGMPRGYELTNAIYAWAVARGIIAGEVS